MAYDHGLREVAFTTTGGNPYLTLSATGTAPRGRAVFGYAKHVIRAASFTPTVTKGSGGVISLRTRATAGAALVTGNIIDTITIASGNKKGKPVYVRGLNTVVSAGSEVQLICTTAGTGVIGRGFLYVESAPADPDNNTKMVESA